MLNLLNPIDFISAYNFIGRVPDELEPEEKNCLRAILVGLTI